MKQLAIALGIFFASFQVHAGLISYEFSGSGGLFTVAGEVVLAEEDAIAGVDLVPEFVSWFFEWTDGASVTGFNDWRSGSLTSGSEFRIDSSGMVSVVNLCANEGGSACVPDNLTNILVMLTEWTGAVPAAIDPIGGGYVEGGGAWSGPNKVPAPAAVFLLSLGVAALALRTGRRD